jgi:hypothetical protein
MRTLSNFRDRFRTYSRDPAACLVIVGSPQGMHDPIGDLFEDSSGEEWTLACRQCGKPTIPSDRISALQWETDAGNHPVPGSFRLCCPVCGAEHIEEESVRMNRDGAYVAQRRHPYRRGFHWGALASPRTWTWSAIAEEQLAAGSTAPLHQHLHFAKSVLGRPYRPRRVTGDQADALREHVLRPTDPQPSAERIALVLFSADTQDNGWYWVVRAVATDQSTYRLAAGFAGDWNALSAAWDASRGDLGAPALGIIDEGGHRSRDVVAFCQARPGLYTYKGNPSIGKPWKISTEDPRRILAVPQHYQADLLWLIYHQPDRSANYWYVDPEAGDDYWEHMGAVRPNKKVRHGDRLENWAAVDAPDHYFDAEKQVRVLLDFAVELLPAQSWRRPPEWGPSAARPPTRRRPSVAFEG